MLLSVFCLSLDEGRFFLVFVYVITPFGVTPKGVIKCYWSLLGNPCARVRGAVIFSKKGMQPSDPGKPCA